MHLHFFGRAPKQTHQIRGHTMFLYPKGHRIFEGHLKAFSNEDVKKLRAKIEDTLKQDKYLKMAELAGV